jgi:MYXO-CTERM domain-containing protein
MFVTGLTNRLQKRLGLTFAIAAALAGAQRASAASMLGAAYEPFDYTAGTQIIDTNGLNGGIGWNASGDVLGANAANANWGNAAARPAPSGAATNPGKTIGSPGLTYSALGYATVTGGKSTIDASLGGTGNSTTNVSRLIGQTVDSGAFYFSYLTRRNNDTQRTTSLTFFGAPVGTTAPQNQAERVAFGQIGTGTAGNAMTGGNFGILFNNSQPGGVVTAANPIPYGTGVTHLIVGRIDWNPTGNETVTMWVDPADVSSEAAAGTPYIVSSGFELTSFDSIRLFSGNQAAAVGTDPIKPAVSTDFDEIRVGGTWDGVTTTTVAPEPSSALFAMVSVGALAALRRRGRR